MLIFIMVFIIVIYVVEISFYSIWLVGVCLKKIVVVLFVVGMVLFILRILNLL